MESSERQKSLVGIWKKLTATKCSEIYPDELEFANRGTYVGKKSQGAGEFTLWDSGEYHALIDNQVKISTANDAEIIYRFSIVGNILSFVDKDGCEFQYRRVR